MITYMILITTEKVAPILVLNTKIKPVVINDLGNEGKVFFLFDRIKVLEILATSYEVEGSYILPVTPKVNKDLTLIGFSI